LQAYPHFGTFATEFYDGSNSYNGGYIRLEKRFTNGFMLSTSYTYSQFREKVAPLNPWRTSRTRSPPSTVRTASRWRRWPSCRSARAAVRHRTGAAW
jgi:hypothetical protein